MTQTSASTAAGEGGAGSTAPVLTSNDDGVLTVRLNGPGAANARNQAMRDALAALWRSVAADPSVQVVILDGTGSPSRIRSRTAPIAHVHPAESA
jgi:hypothetical protein